MRHLVARAVWKILFRRHRTFRFGAFAIGEREMHDIGKLFQ